MGTEKSSSGEPRGLCPSCGHPNGLMLRLDKRSVPYVTCCMCSTRVFTRPEGGPFRWLATLAVLRQDIQNKNEEIYALSEEFRSWFHLQARTRPEVLQPRPKVKVKAKQPVGAEG